MSLLEGRVAIVTGAAGGLGSAVCRVLEREGAAVVGVDVVGDGVLVLDAGIEDGVRAMIDTALAEHGRLDVLVLNAGIQHMQPIAEFDVGAWDRLMDVMLKGPFLAMKHAWPHIARPGGRIVVTASVSSFTAEKYKAAYIAAKHGVAGLVKVAALEGAEVGLTANAVAPGLMMTPLIESQLADQERLHGISREEVLARFLAEGPASRPVDTVEVAETIAFLASDRASGINGAVVPVDLGLLAC
ncbi:MAG: SDR family NAD(P)-dependent oxidoreductase [Gaiellaceae bacterium]